MGMCCALWLPIFTQKSSSRFVLCDMEKPVSAVHEFEAQLMLMELDHRSVFTAGYDCMMHIHTAEEEVTVKKLLTELDKKTGELKTKLPRFVKSGAVCTVRLQVPRSLCVEAYADFPQLGRFTLRDEGRTIAIGKVLKVIKRRKKTAATAAGGGQ